MIVASPSTTTTQEPQLYRISLQKYFEMAETGVFDSDSQVELLEGLLVSKMAQSPLHRFVLSITRRSLESLLSSGFHLEMQIPVVIGESCPEPDIAIIRGTPEDYAARHPDASEILLAIEISQTSLSSDRTWKKKIYAAGGIAIYWIINLEDRQIEVYSQPDPAAEDYHQHAIYSLQDKTPVIINQQEVGVLEVSQLFPTQN